MEEDPESAAEVYDTNRFSDLYHASRRPSPQHLCLAARFLVALFRGHSVFFAFLGGWAVYLRGGGRRTEDVDVSVATSMESLTAILMQEERCEPAPWSCFLAVSFSPYIPEVREYRYSGRRTASLLSFHDPDCHPRF